MIKKITELAKTIFGIFDIFIFKGISGNATEERF